MNEVRSKLHFSSPDHLRWKDYSKKWLEIVKGIFARRRKSTGNPWEERWSLYKFCVSCPNSSTADLGAGETMGSKLSCPLSDPADKQPIRLKPYQCLRSHPQPWGWSLTSILQSARPHPLCHPTMRQDHPPRRRHGKEHNLWVGAIGKERLGKVNTNRTLLLITCQDTC